MAKKVGCQKCEERATLYVRAFGKGGWAGLYCDRCMGRVIRMRGKLIRKHKLNVVIRAIADRDRKEAKR